jgi:NitT/TauT family transport system substrate-binding protein
MSRIALSRLALGRRAILAGVLAFAGQARAAGRPTIRLGLVQFGTVQWIADVIRRHRLDAAHGFTLTTVPLASTDASRVAIMAGQADIVVLDWPFVAVQRGAGTKLSFAPFSSSSGGIMVRANATVRELADLKGRRLGVAGGPVDKSWLVVQAAARKQADLDLAKAAQIAYGTPPLLDAKLQQGELDAVLTFWNFAARLETEGCVQIVSVADCAEALGLPPRLDLIGFVFREDWAGGANSGVDGFLAAAAQAERILASSAEEWQAIRPLMGAPDDRLFARLRERFSAGVATPLDAVTQERNAAHLFAILKETGGTRATGGLESIPQGLFWHAGHGVG